MTGGSVTTVARVGSSQPTMCSLTNRGLAVLRYSASSYYRRPWYQKQLLYKGPVHVVNIVAKTL